MSTGPLLALRIDRSQPLGLQIERQLRALVGSPELGLGAELPSTRALAADLGVSRGVVVGAYAQLAAEGYITLRRGTAPTVAALARAPAEVGVDFDVPIAAARFNLRPDLPDLGLFPRADWLSAERAAFHRAANTDLAYGEPLGARRLRRQLAPFLARTRGVQATVDRTAIAGGSSQALHVLAARLRAGGARRIAVEDPGHRWRTRTLVSSGLEVVPMRDPGEPLADVDVVVVSPDHRFPLGTTLPPDARRALVDWAVSGDRLVIEHDYDGHFRYDRPAAGTLQALAPEHVAYVGSASALLAPTLRLGWAVLPARLVEPFAAGMFAHAVAPPRLQQLTLAELIERGYLDRHLRRARAAYRRRREAALAALERRLPQAEIGGAPAGLYVSVALPEGTDEARVLAAARARGLAIDGVNEHALRPQPPALALGFAASPEPTLRRAIKLLGEALAQS
jgi:GntR family transcriptional regulator / MocR family aminotransferase